MTDPPAQPPAADLALGLERIRVQREQAADRRQELMREVERLTDIVCALDAVLAAASR